MEWGGGGGHFHGEPKSTETELTLGEHISPRCSSVSGAANTALGAGGRGRGF